MGAASSSLENHFLVAMPGMRDQRFLRAVIYLCAHNEEGAMGLIVNQPQQLAFPDILIQLGVLDHDQAIRLPRAARDLPVHNGGPVDRSRGFVLHSGDMVVESSMPVTPGICLTATIDILRAISLGHGPRHALMALGYAGWGAGQLEMEIGRNGWLTCPATPELLFEGDNERKYDGVLAALGIDAARLSHFAGHA